MLLFDVELLLYVYTLLDKASDLPLQLAGKAVSFIQLVESLELFSLLDILGTNISYQSTNPVDVVCQAHHTDYLDEDQAESLLIIGRIKISKPDGEHDVDSPVVGPDIFLIPKTIVDIFYIVPVMREIDVGHGCENDGKDMCKTKVEENNFNQRPVLLIVPIFKERYFQFLHFLQTLWQLSDNKQPSEVRDIAAGRTIDQKDQQIKKVDHHVCL